MSFLLSLVLGSCVLLVALVAVVVLDDTGITGGRKARRDVPPQDAW